MDKKDIYLYIKSIKGISSITLGKIIDEVGSIEEIVKLNEKDIYNLKNIKLIYYDLAILYKVLYEINKIEFNQLNQYAKMHINEMQNIADLYLEKSNLEAYSTTLGKTILFLNSNFSTFLSLLIGTFLFLFFCTTFPISDPHLPLFVCGLSIYDILVQKQYDTCIPILYGLNC